MYTGVVVFSSNIFFLKYNFQSCSVLGTVQPRLSSHVGTGTYLDIIKLNLTGYGNFSKNRLNMHLEKLQHLWMLQSCVIYSLLSAYLRQIIIYKMDI